MSDREIQIWMVIISIVTIVVVVVGFVLFVRWGNREAEKAKTRIASRRPRPEDIDDTDSERRHS